MAWPSFPAATVTSAEQTLAQMCGGSAWTAVFLETWMFLETQHESNWVCTAQAAWFAPPGQTNTSLTLPRPAGCRARVNPMGTKNIHPWARNQPDPRGQQRHRKNLQGATGGFGLEGTLDITYVCLYLAEGFAFCVCLESLSSDWPWCRSASVWGSTCVCQTTKPQNRHFSSDT